jgi:hypothetical protein
MTLKPFPMGMTIAERKISAYDQNGEKRQITVRLGAPVRVAFPNGTQPLSDLSQPGIVRCPLQITGLDVDERVYPIAGGDEFEALQYAIDFAGDILLDGSARLGLKNRSRVDASTRSHWVWQFPPDQSEVGNRAQSSAPPPDSRA